jgi:potassium-transporting ATPase potassium-binding subunit
MEGKETRFGVFDSALFSSANTAASCGSSNAAQDSFTPLGGFVLLVNMLLGEIIFGGVGMGLCGMVIYIIMTVFISGLMIGRTPEYVGKKIESREVKYSMLALIIPALSILVLSSIATLSPVVAESLGNSGAHGLSEIIYAYTSATSNNGGSFSGLSSNNMFWNITLAVAMFLGRYCVMIPVMGIAGSLAAKKIRLGTSGSFPVSGGLFICLLIAVIFIIGALTFLPSLSLGPILEHFQMIKENSI